MHAQPSSELSTEIGIAQVSATMMRTCAWCDSAVPACAGMPGRRRGRRGKEKPVEPEPGAVQEEDAEPGDRSAPGGAEREAEPAPAQPQLVQPTSGSAQQEHQHLAKDPPPLPVGSIPDPEPAAAQQVLLPCLQYSRQTPSHSGLQPLFLGFYQ